MYYEKSSMRKTTSVFITYTQGRIKTSATVAAVAKMRAPSEQCNLLTV